MKAKVTEAGISINVVLTPLTYNIMEQLGSSVEIIAFAIDPEARVTDLNTLGECTIREFFNTGNVAGQPIDIDTLPRITKEQFYDLSN